MAPAQYYTELALVWTSPRPRCTKGRSRQSDALFATRHAGILFQSAHILDLQEGFFTGIAESAIDRLCGKHPVPYRGLRSILRGDAPLVSLEDTYRRQLNRKSASTLSQMMGRLSRRGVGVLREYAELQ